MSWYMGLAPLNIGSIFPAVAPVIMDMDRPRTVKMLERGRKKGQKEIA